MSPSLAHLAAAAKAAAVPPDAPTNAPGGAWTTRPPHVTPAAAETSAAAENPPPTRARAYARPPAAATTAAKAARTARDCLASLTPGLWRHRRRLTPTLTAVLAWVAAIGVHAGPLWLRLAVLPAAAALCGLGVLALAAPKHPMPAAAWWTMAVAGLWLSLAALGVPPLWPPAVAAWAVLALPLVVYWTRPRRTYPTDVPALIATWRLYLGNPDTAAKAPLAGSYVHAAWRITDPAGQIIGDRVLVELPPGQMTIDDVVAKRRKIASAYGLATVRVHVEHLDDAREDGCWVSLYTRSPLEEIQHWPGPQLDDDGTFPVGVHDDGTTARFRFWSADDGALSTLIVGASGSGKSGTGNCILGTARHSGGRIVTWLADPKGSQSAPAWVDAVDRAALSLGEIRTMLRDAVAEMDARSRFIGSVRWTDPVTGKVRKGLSTFTPMHPAHGLPLLLVWIEEATTVLQDKECVALVERLATASRSAGLHIALVIQQPTVQAIGGSSVIRSQIARQVLVFRTTDKNTGQMAFQGSLAVDPTKIPVKLKGMAYLVADQAREAPLRGYYVEDPYHWAEQGTTPRLPPLPRAPSEPITPAPTRPTSATPPPADPAPATPDAPAEAPPSLLAPLKGRRTALRAAQEYLDQHGPSPRADVATAVATQGWSKRQARAVLGEGVASGDLLAWPDDVLALPGHPEPSG